MTFTTHPCLFLDRDGTINEEKNFIADPDEVELIPGAAEAIRKAKELGFKVIVISNQSGVARGFLSENDVTRVNARIQQLLADEHTSVDALYYCPHYFDNVPECDCRKPKSGLFNRAREEHSIDFTRSIMVGDRLSDMEAGRKIGATTILVLTGYGSTLKSKWGRIPPEIDYIVPSLKEGVPIMQEKFLEWNIAKEW